MNKVVLILVAACVACGPSRPTDPDAARWKQTARNVTIIRDDWGIPHIHGKTDADAVFGLIYAQAEDDFNRVEMNYLTSIGRVAETEGVSALYQDLRQKLFINPDSMVRKYAASPPWLKTLMVAWADGLNFYLYKHPKVTPRVIKRFEPWMALTFSEGSIGGDIERVALGPLQAMYGGGGGRGGSASGLTGADADAGFGTTLPGDADDDGLPPEPGGSNGVAIAPSNTAGHHALLLINPHTSFFFRAEVQVSSDEGLNAYGAVTWGQFFVYQGFNENAGWMHTSSGVDAIDEFAETIVRKDSAIFYKHGKDELPVITTKITVPFKTDSGMSKREFTVYYTQHGPVIREQDGKWISISLMQDQVKALTQSFTRTKATDYKSFRETMELHTNSSNNTIFADKDGDIAYFHGNYIPKRDPKFDWTKPVDGSNPATDYKGILSVDESPHLLNPASGWLYNTNNSPWTAAGPNSPKKEDYPVYVETGGESARAMHAVLVLKDKKDFTPATLRDAAFDSYLTLFARMVPPLIEAYDKAPASNPLKAKLAEQIATLRDWDFRWSATSVPTALAVYWGEELGRRAGPDARRAGLPVDEFMATKASSDQRLEALDAASRTLIEDFGTWKTPWGDINRFQRLTGDIVQPFNDSGPSIPVAFTSARWGSLASFGARTYRGTKKMYGTSGNSFVAVIEFGDSVRAKAVTAGGENGDPTSPHFNDQAARYTTGDLRDVYFYPGQLKGHTQRTYHPGS